MVGAVSNPAANFTINALNRTSNQTTALATQLASGLAVNRAADNVATLASSTRLLAEGSAFGAIQNNIGQAQALLRSADGGLAQIDTLLNRNTQLAVQAASGNIGDFERGLLDEAFQANLREIDRIAADLDFNDINPIAGTTRQDFDFRTGTGVNPTEDRITASVNPASVDALGLTNASIATAADAETAITSLSVARELNIENRATIGALDSRLEIADRFVNEQGDLLTQAGQSQIATNIPQAITAFQNSLNLLDQQIAVTALNNRQQGLFLRLFA